jgi:hypothetical protein
MKSFVAAILSALFTEAQAMYEFTTNAANISGTAGGKPVNI